MIALDFALDDAEVAVLRAELANANPAAIQETYLMTPVRLRIGETELLKVPGSPREDPPFLTLPLLHVATLGADSFRGLMCQHEVRYALPGTGVSLRMRRSGHTAYVESELTGEIASTDVSELLRAVDVFVARVKAAVWQAVPGLADIEPWRRWLLS